MSVSLLSHSTAEGDTVGFVVEGVVVDQEACHKFDENKPKVLEMVFVGVLGAFFHFSSSNHDNEHSPHSNMRTVDWPPT